MQALVTGGAGFVGTNLIKRLLKEGHKVISLDNYSTGKKENEQNGCKYYELDLSSKSSLGSLDSIGIVNKISKFDVVFHLAAKARVQPSFNNPEEYIDVNFKGTYNIVRYCTRKNIPLIYAGSSSHHSGKYKNPYTFSKDMGEEIIQLYTKNFGLKATIARFYNVYGPYQLTEGGYTTLIGRWINNIEKGIECEIYGDGNQSRDFTHVEDIIKGLTLIAAKKSYGYIFELGRGRDYTVNDVAKMFNIKPKYKPEKPGEARQTLADYHLINKVLGWEPKINLIDYVTEYRNNR